ncbi:virB8 family protein [Arhodomonas sp. AD133]|uniref:virB8 family protein n=1 Tax=Arhodomonas sp. AD133 TaxID=3415009 RepID=UPI003EC0F2EA
MKGKKARKQGVAPDEEGAYYEESRLWDDEVYQKAKLRERRGWLIGGGGLVLAVLQAIALVGLTPLKTAEPYVIRVDKSTGIVEVIQAMEDGGTITEDEAVTKYFIGQYMQAREQYDSQDFARSFRRVEAFSSGKAERAYYAEMDESNPKSPVNVYGRKAQVTITIKSISFLNQNTAIVRWIRTKKTRNRESVSHWLSVRSRTIPWLFVK